MPWSEFLEEISHSQFCVKPEHVPAGSSLEEPIAELVPVTYSLRSILGIRTEAVKRWRLHHFIYVIYPKLLKVAFEL